MTNGIIETERLILREMNRDDLCALRLILQDAEVMYAYEHAFEDAEVDGWLDKQLQRYKSCGFGLWAVVLKECGEMIGQCGLSMQSLDGADVLEIGYLFQKRYWHKGYATEAALACKDYAFLRLNAREVYSLIRTNNTASQNVARRNGMEICGEMNKFYYGIDMPHYVFRVKNDSFHDA